MDNLGLFTELEGWSNKEAREEFRRDIPDFENHPRRGAWTQNEHEDYGDSIQKSLAARQDGVAFNTEGREYALLEFTQPMDSWEDSPEVPEDWCLGGVRGRYSVVEDATCVGLA